MADRNFEALDEALKRPAPAAPELTAPTVENLDDDSADDANWAYLDGDPFISHEEELAAVADAVSAAPRVLDALRSVLDGKLQHCTYPNGTMAIATEDESHLGLELNSSPDAVTELTVHRGFCGEFDIVFFGRQPRTTLVAFSAGRTRADIAVGLRGRRLLSRDVSWCNTDMDLEPEEVAWTPRRARVAGGEGEEEQTGPEEDSESENASAGEDEDNGEQASAGGQHVNAPAPY